jgi:hypothetical protein
MSLTRTRMVALALCIFSLLNSAAAERVFAAEQDCTGFEQRAADRSEAGNWWFLTAAGVLAALGIDYIDDGKKDAPSRGLAIGAGGVAAGFAGLGLYSKASAHKLRRVCTARAEAVSELVLAQ